MPNRESYLAEEIANCRFVQRTNELINRLSVPEGNDCRESSDLELLPERETVFVICINFYKVQRPSRMSFSFRIGSELFQDGREGMTWSTPVGVKVNQDQPTFRTYDLVERLEICARILLCTECC